MSTYFTRWCLVFLLHGEDIFFYNIIYKTVVWQCLLFSRTGLVRILFPFDIADIQSIVCVYFFHALVPCFYTVRIFPFDTSSIELFIISVYLFHALVPSRSPKRSGYFLFVTSFTGQSFGSVYFFHACSSSPLYVVRKNSFDTPSEETSILCVYFLHA